MPRKRTGAVAQDPSLQSLDESWRGLAHYVVILAGDHHEGPRSGSVHRTPSERLGSSKGLAAGQLCVSGTKGGNLLADDLLAGGSSRLERHRTVRRKSE